MQANLNGSFQEPRAHCRMRHPSFTTKALAIVGA
jgi:hypothetical protein